MNGSRAGWRKTLALAVIALCATSLLGSGCFSGGIGPPGGSCQSTRQYFLTEVWGPVMGRTCVNCHSPGGDAIQRGARFELLPATYPDFVETNLANIAAMANTLYESGGRRMSVLLAKPLGMMNHGGGQVFHEGDASYTAMAGLLDRLGREAQSGQSGCADYGSLAAPSGVQQLTYPQTLRRAALDMLGRLPTPEETARASDEAGFEAVLREMTNEPAFYARWRTAFNDMMLTDRYVTGDGCDQRALNLISGTDFPNRGQYGGAGAEGLECCGDDRDNPACQPVRQWFRDANNAVAREPINLFEHVVRENRPFSEILTADYVMVNPMSAHIYGVQGLTFPDPYDASDLREGRFNYTRRYSMTDSESQPYPHAGLLTSPVFLARYPTTTTNRNRHRARIVQGYFLATDILRVGERPIDSTSAEALVQNATMNYGPCVMCHRINDPIAGAFRGFFPNQTEWRFDPRDQWHSDMLPPGYAGENMPRTSYRSGLQWLAPRITSDPRFVSSVVRFIFKTLTGREPLTHPGDPAEATYEARATAWANQDRIFRAIGRQFIADNMNFRTAVVEMIKSPLYRAIAGPVGATPAQIAGLDGLGANRMLTPEMLARRVEAVAGFRWSRGNDPPVDYLLSDYYLLYGGINSDTIITRATDPSGIIANISIRMANEISCRGTAGDFARDVANRRFFPNVERNTVPESAGNPVPASITLIRQNLVHLHRLILGEELAPNDPEIDRSYNLFLDTWREMQTTMSNELPGECRAERDPATGTEFPMDRRFSNDPNGTVRAWMAVLTYLFSDYRFIYN